MTTHSWALISLLLCALSVPSGPAEAQKCDNVDASVSNPLADVSLPPKDSCSIRFVNGYPVPDPACTPGAANPTVTLGLLRDAHFRVVCLANSQIPGSDRAAIFDWYRVALPAENTGINQTCELDHLIPLELGGADSLENIWPLCGPGGAPLAQRYFKEKTLVDSYLLAQVKSGAVSLDKAQRDIATNWAQYLDAAQPSIASSGNATVTKDKHGKTAAERVSATIEIPPDTVNLYIALLE